MRSESGFTMIEMMVAAVVLAMAVMVTINVFGINMSSSAQTRSQLRASVLATSKLDEFKDYARRSSMAGSFQRIRDSAFAINNALTTNVTKIDDINYTWRVQSFYSTQDLSVNPPAVSDAGIPTKMLRLVSTVDWNYGSDPRKITMTTYVADVTP